jgi:hypothetical protein
MKSTLFSVFSGKSGGFPRGRARQGEISVSGGLFLGGRWSGESAASWGLPNGSRRIPRWARRCPAARRDAGAGLCSFLAPKNEIGRAETKFG